MDCVIAVPLGARGAGPPPGAEARPKNDPWLVLSGRVGRVWGATPSAICLIDCVCVCVFCVQLLCVCGQFCDWRSGACSVAGACAPRRLAAVCLLSEVLSVSLQFLVRHHARFSQRLCLLVGNRWPSRLVASFLAGSSGGGGSAGSLSYCDVDVYTSQLLTRLHWEAESG